MQLVVGNQRSYSDVCRLTDGEIKHAGNEIYYEGGNFIVCQAGATIGEVAKVIMPKGWFFAVTPGTRHATIGGCIANDVHGKNHQAAGSFGNHVLSVVLNGKSYRLYDPLFKATVGGLGLTGKIESASIALVPRTSLPLLWYWPLDYIPGYWPLYKRMGFWQYHCVVPQKVVPWLLKKVRQRPLLRVRKQFGNIPSAGMLSFCRPGISLSFDFAKRDDKMQGDLDHIVVQSGGAVYPAKTAMSSYVFRSSFPRWREFSKYVHPDYSSDFWKRVSCLG